LEQYRGGVEQPTYHSCRRGNVFRAGSKVRKSQKAMWKNFEKKLKEKVILLIISQEDDDGQKQECTDHVGIR
jgi:hypothetical protein